MLLLDSLLAAMEKLFDDACEVVVNASGVLNLQSWSAKENSSDFGEKDTQQLIDYFKVPELGPNLLKSNRSGIYSRPSSTGSRIGSS